MKNVVSFIEMQTRQVMEFHDITEKVREAVKKSNVKEGLVNVFTQHTTCCVKINEFEEKLMQDFYQFLEKRVPQFEKYGHDINPVDGRKNAHSHLKSLILNTSECIPLQKGELLLGTWQRVFFVELDGPREKRKVIVQVLGE
ncbi:MAG: YjbQ family protein [Candidatus Diapherotrites archaeon]|nr:YjbQ family protein [Candidatus Diapherotrites archaeon]